MLHGHELGTEGIGAVMDPESLAISIQRMKARVSQRRGANAELLVALRLRGMGFHMVEKIEVGWKKIGGRWLRAAKVSGDFRAVGQGGRSCLFEVKFRADRLRWNDLEHHQVRALDAHANAGGASFLVWVHHAGLEVMPWPCVGFGPGCSIDATRIPGNTP